ncbi:MAG: response regulator [Anaerotignum sp.]|nr:response regulator [Anaerotignum sp.]
MIEKYKILLVDDEEEVRTSMIQKIDWEKSGFVVIGDAENGKDALEKIEILEPDVVLTDIRMPYMDGLELAQELRRQRPSVKVVIFSGYDDFVYAKQAIQLNIIEYILKPVNARELTDILGKIKNNLDEEIECLRGETAQQENMKKNLLILRENFLGKLVKGKIEKKQIEHDLKEYDLPLLKSKYWTALKFKLGNGENAEDRDGKLIAVQNLLDNRMQEWGGYASFHRPSGLCAIVGLEKESDITDLMAFLDDICRESRRILNQPLTIGMGQIADQIEKIEQSYNGAREAVAYSDIAGDIIYINDVEPRQEAVLCLDEKMEAELNYALRFGDEEKIISCVENIVQPMKAADGKGVQAYLISILYVILRVVQKHELDEQLVFGKYTDYHGVLSGIDTAEGLFQWLSEICFSINARIVSERKGTTRTIVQKAKKYIEENYQNSHLSLEMVCEHLHISAAYFSTVFKKEAGESYSSYLTGLRMEKAAELMKTTDEKNYSIAAQVGYDEPNYFSHVFKKRYGVSPNKFRGK